MKPMREKEVCDMGGSNARVREGYKTGRRGVSLKWHGMARMIAVSAKIDRTALAVSQLGDV
jgi:hypothetical protein